VLSVDLTNAPIDWLDSDHVIRVYCRSMSVPPLYKGVTDFVQGSYELRVSRKLEEFRRVF
jgi:predicted acylesterase/phospholipase RssA